MLFLKLTHAYISSNWTSSIVNIFLCQEYANMFAMDVMQYQTDFLHLYAIDIWISPVIINTDDFCIIHKMLCKPISSSNSMWLDLSGYKVV